MKKEETTNEIDLVQLFMVILKKWWIAAAGAVVCAAAAFLFTYFLITPQYTSSIKMYVNNSSDNVANQTSMITINDITASKNLVGTYSVILKTRLTLEEVIRQADVPYSYEQLVGMVSAEAVDQTEVLKISVTCASPADAYKIANTIGTVLPVKISKIVDGSSVSIVDRAFEPSGPSSPNYVKNTIAGFMAGAVIAVALIILTFFLNDVIDSEDKLTGLFGEDIPVLAVIPDVNAENHGKYGYYSASKRGGKEK